MICLRIYSFLKEKEKIVSKIDYLGIERKYFFQLAKLVGGFNLLDFVYKFDYLMEFSWRLDTGEVYGGRGEEGIYYKMLIINNGFDQGFNYKVIYFKSYIIMFRIRN